VSLGHLGACDSSNHPTFDATFETIFYAIFIATMIVAIPALQINGLYMFLRPDLMLLSSRITG
jgi:hypothetical protein